MPRYFFHVCDHENFVDLQGTDLRTVEAAKREAVRFAAALLCDRPEQFFSGAEWTREVVTEEGEQVAVLQFAGSATASSGG